jgi:hypothetical protein
MWAAVPPDGITPRSEVRMDGNTDRWRRASAALRRRVAQDWWRLQRGLAAKRGVLEPALDDPSPEMAAPREATREASGGAVPHRVVFDHAGRHTLH